MIISICSCVRFFDLFVYSSEEIINHAMVSLYQMWFDKDKKKNAFRIPFSDESATTVMNLFDNMWQTMVLYSIMCVLLKWVVSDKLLESVLSLMDVLVTANFR